MLAAALLACGLGQTRSLAAPLPLSQPKTAQGLAKHCAAQAGMLFWYGTFGQTASLDLLNQKRAQYPAQMTAARYDYAKKYHVKTGKRVYDCAGLVKSYWMQPTTTAPPVYVGKYDLSADGFYRVCTRRGTIQTLPEAAGALVFMVDSGGKMHHVGVCLGGGRVAEARGFDYGVVITGLKARPWTHWGRLPDSWMTAEDNTLKVGSRAQVKRGITEYYPGLPMSPWVQGQVFTVREVTRNGKEIVLGGKRCVLLDEVNTWCAVENLVKA